MMACKTFYETRTMEGLKHWVKLVCVDLAERLVSEYRTRRRIPKSFAVHQTGGSPNAARTRSVPPFVLNLQDETATRERLIQRMMDALSSRFVPTELFPCTRLGLGAQLGAAEDTCSIQRLFLSAGTNTNSASVSSGDFVRPDSTLREPGSSSSDIDCSDSKHLRPGSSHSLAQSKVCRKRKRFSSETLCRCQYDSVIIMPSSQ